MKILVLPDRANWAYFSIAKALEKYNHRPDVRIKIMPIKGNEKRIKDKYKKYDRFLVMGWQTYDRIKFLPKDLTSVGVHSFHSWDDRKTTPDKSAKPPRDLIKHLSSFKSVNALSDRLYHTFVNRGLRNMTYTPNGVDTEIFRRVSMPPIKKTLIVGYSGSKAHDWRKGVSEFIIPAAKKAGVKFRLAMLSTDKYIPLEEMYKFYNEIDCYVCASSSEGMSLSVLEAAACGRPIVTTRCSGNVETIKEGETGFFVDRDVRDMAEKISMLKDRKVLQTMSDNVVADMKENWCWSIRAKAWIDFMAR